MESWTKTSDGSRQTSSVQSIDRAMSILNSFTPTRPELGLSEVARATGLTSSTTHRLLASLQRHGMIQQGSRNGTYRLGPHLFRLARGARIQLDLASVARPVMAWLRDDTGETVGLHVLQEEPLARLVIEQAEGLHALRRSYAPEIGTPIPIHQGAPGKALLAYLDEDHRGSVLSGRLAAATDRTIVDPGALRGELSLIRERGFALSFEERVQGISTLAVPVRDHTGTVLASLSVSGPSTRLPEQRLLELAPVAQHAATTLSTNLGCAER